MQLRSTRLTAYGRGRTAWTPAQISTALWLDAADANTITLNGSTVSQWADKSGNGRNVVQPNATAQPTYSSTALNGKPALSFDGAGDAIYLETVAKRTGIFQDTPGATVFAVASFANNSVTRHLIQCQQSGTIRYVQNVSTVSQNFGGTRLDTDTLQTVSWVSFTADQVNVQAGILDYQNSDAFFYFNGTLRASTLNFQTAGNSSNTALTVFNLGFGTFQGNMSEVIALNYAPLTSERQKIEGYLAWKWGGI